MANGMRMDGDQIRQMPLHMQEQVAMALVHPGNNQTVYPIVPGHTDQHNIAEISFQNGAQHTKKEIIGKLQKIGENIPCVTIAQAIKIVEEL